MGTCRVIAVRPIGPEAELWGDGRRGLASALSLQRPVWPNWSVFPNGARRFAGHRVDLARRFLGSRAIRHLHRSPRPPAMARRSSLFPSKKERSEEHTSDLQSLMRNSYAVFCFKK